MDRTERLFVLMDVLRRHRRPITAASLAEEMSVSVRTVYRDVQTLIGLGAPIDGEAGVGYLLRSGFFLPPLMFDANELEALVLGVRWVERQGDEELAFAATNALAKIATAAPQDLRDRISETGLWASPSSLEPSHVPMLKVIREAIRREQTLEIRYEAENGTRSERTIWPIALAFYENRPTLAAWCELRVNFRHFRADRIIEANATGARYPERRTALFKAYIGRLGTGD